jgi:hypothetical protein
LELLVALVGNFCSIGTQGKPFRQGVSQIHARFTTFVQSRPPFNVPVLLEALANSRDK